MPELYDTEIPARELRDGDVVFADGCVTGRPQVGTKWVKATLTNGKRQYGIDQAVTVRRSRPTAEERAAANLRVKLEGLDYLEANTRRRAEVARQSCIQDLERGRVPNWSDLESVAELAGHLYCWDRVNGAHLHMVLGALEHGAHWSVVPSRMDAVRYVVEETLDDVLMRARLGGSTSPASRLTDEGKTAGQAQWVRQMRSTLTPDTF